MKTICGNNCNNNCNNSCGTIKKVDPQTLCRNDEWPILTLTKNGQEFYPLTHTKAIIGDNCLTLDDIFRSIDTKINTLILDVNVNIYDDEPISLFIDDDGVCRLNPAWIASQHKAIRLISEDPTQDEVIVYMDRAEIVPVLNDKGNFIYNAENNIVATTYWRFVYNGYEYVIDSTCNANVYKAAEGGSGSGISAIVREDTNGNHPLRVNSQGMSIIPLVTETSSGLIRYLDYKKLKALIDILDSHDPENHTIIINKIKYKLTPYTDKFLWTNELNWDEGNNWE